MTLQAQYKSFLARPTAPALSADASIHYIPTLSTFNNSQGILKHLEKQEQQLKVKTNFLNAIENERALCVETESTIQFLLGGSAYLPKLDDNFLADRTVTLPITHIVEFDSESKITQIRLLWDQASLLKSVEVIGARASNWPISEGKDQARLMASSIAHAPQSSQHVPKAAVRSSRIDAMSGRSAGLSLFEARELPQSTSPRNAISPRESARPQPRAYDEVFGDDEPLSPSPTKGSGHIKSGAGQNHQSNRLFDIEAKDTIKSVEPSIKTNPTKFTHFDMNETSVNAPNKNALRATKQATQWSFEDFATPKKPTATFRDRNERSANWTPDATEANKPDVKIPYRPTARKDAATHFEFSDSTPAAPKPMAHKESLQAQSSNNLYHDPVVGADWTSGRDNESHTSEPAPLANITNRANQQRTHFDMADASPTKKGVASAENVKLTNTAAAGKARNMLVSSWDFYDDAPAPEKGIKIAGDGMGNRKTTEKSWWEM